MERRNIDNQHAIVRAVRNNDGIPSVITGYAAVFYRADDAGTEYRLWDDLYERIAPGAFSRAISEKHDARGLFNHDVNSILGRVAANTLRLSVDQVGLRYEITLPDTQAGRDILASIERGDITGSSFAFVPKKVTWTEEEERVTRIIEDLDLYDVGPVTFPAYESTSTGIRSSERGSIEKELQDWRQSVISEREKIEQARAVAARCTEIRVDNL